MTTDERMTLEAILDLTIYDIFDGKMDLENRLDSIAENVRELLGHNDADAIAEKNAAERYGD